MKTGLLLTAIVLLVVSLGCIGWSVVEVIRGDLGMWTARFLGAAAFHGVTAIIAAVLLGAVRGGCDICCKPSDETATQKPSEEGAS
ncbi:MAG: hypothetical protein ACYTFO_07460 [Planctomycetota bacterium]|jgi:hypothetical protein